MSPDNAERPRHPSLKIGSIGCTMVEECSKWESWQVGCRPSKLCFMMFRKARMNFSDRLWRTGLHVLGFRSYAILNYAKWSFSRDLSILAFAELGLSPVNTHMYVSPI